MKPGLRTAIPRLLARGGAALLVGCTSAPAPAPIAEAAPVRPATPPAPDAKPAVPGGGIGSVSELLALPTDQIGQSVTVRGRYTGWRGGCRGGPPVSRSDWMLEDERACIYVHGPLPIGGLPPEAHQGIRPMVVEGVLRRHSDGRLYLEMAP